MNMWTKQLKLHADLILCLLMAAVFLIWPSIDLAVSGWFFRDGEGFFLADNPLVQFSYHLFAEIDVFVLFPLLLWFAWSLFRTGPTRLIAYLLVVLIVGPGMVVNWGVKEYSGRARPLTTEVFGGEKIYSPAFRYADQCNHNCSFVSGHAAMGFYFLSLAWVTGRRRWLWLGIGIGALVGLGRILQGAHFFSDVIFSFWIVYFTAFLMAKLFFGATRIKPQDDVGPAE